MIPIIPGVFTFTGLLVGHVYAIEDPDGLTLIDASIPPVGGRILRQIEEAGKKPADVKRILITHAHPDHIGALPQLKQATGAQVMVSAQDRPVVEGKAPVVRRPARFRPPNTAIKGTPVDREIGEGDVLPVLGGLHVLFTPGHSPGHVTFWQPDKRIAFIGDVLFHVLGIRLPPGFLTVDMAENKRSLKRIAELDADIVCFGHGAPLTQNAAPQIRDFARKIGAL